MGGRGGASLERGITLPVTKSYGLRGRREGKEKETKGNGVGRKEEEVEGKGKFRSGGRTPVSAQYSRRAQNLTQAAEVLAIHQKRELREY